MAARGNEIRPYDEDGEIAYYRLVLELNEVGEAFLLLDQFLRSADAGYPMVLPE